MSQQAHTPGPWQIIVEPAKDYDGWRDDGGYRIDADGVEQLAFIWSEGRRLPPNGGPQSTGPQFGARQAEANARLIAAAPDMLAALKSLVGQSGEGVKFSDRMNAALDAIAKAEGR